jgi:retron-type reverse transcriptase
VNLMDTIAQAPGWLLRPLPVNASDDEKLNAQIDEAGKGLPGTMQQLVRLLEGVRMYREFDSAVNRACVHVWRVREQFLSSDNEVVRKTLLTFAREYMVEAAQARILRRLVKDPSPRLREMAQGYVEKAHFREVALPAKAEGAWDSTGWFKGIQGAPIRRHKQGSQVQEQHGVPTLKNVEQLRELLQIRSAPQLGFFLLATHDDGDDQAPYVLFTIPKRDGSPRTICAPKPQLRWTQRRILSEILDKVPAHDAAHGFLTGRSTVTNAQPHLGAEVVLKFDLKDFFPTIHYYRVVGLFASLGYGVAECRFSTADDSRAVAPTLARLCCYSPDHRKWGNALVPQGAPTSPAISNLVCRRLDARLSGLAKRNHGVYTRYADDLTFSFRDKVPNLGRFRWWVDQVCHQEGFIVNQDKFRVIRASQRQLVTGIVVNDELRIPRDARRRFRAILFNCKKHGVASQAREHPRFEAYLRGLASYVNMVHPEEGAELMRQVEELLGEDKAE